MPMLQLSKELWINPWRIAHVTRVGPEERVRIEFSEGASSVFIDGEPLEILKSWLNQYKWNPPKPPLPSPHRHSSLGREAENELVTASFTRL
jgi:hypothetical protein